MTPLYVCDMCAVRWHVDWDSALAVFVQWDRALANAEVRALLSRIRGVCAAVARILGGWVGG